MDTLYFFLPMILFLGFITTYEDYKLGKIRNLWIIIALAYSLAINSFFFFTSKNTGYFIELSVNVALALVLGFAMYLINFWNAGDAKLFTAFTALIPLEVYNIGYIPYFSSSNIFINTFVPFFALYSIYILFKSTWKQKLYYLKLSFEPKQVVGLALFVFAFLWPLSFLTRTFGLPSNYFFMVFFFFIMLILLEKFVKSKMTITLVVASLLRFIFDPTVYTLQSWISLFWLIIGFMFLRYFILYMSYDFLTREVDMHLLKPGMIPAEVVYKKDGKFLKRKLLHFSLISYMQEARAKETLFNPTPEGLSKQDIKRLKRIERHEEHLRVYKTLSLAPYLFAGVILTILFKGNMFISIAQAFSS